MRAEVICAGKRGGRGAAGQRLLSFPPTRALGSVRVYSCRHCIPLFNIPTPAFAPMLLLLGTTPFYPHHLTKRPTRVGGGFCTKPPHPALPAVSAHAAVPGHGLGPRAHLHARPATCQAERKTFVKGLRKGSTLPLVLELGPNAAAATCMRHFGYGSCGYYCCRRSLGVAAAPSVG